MKGWHGNRYGHSLASRGIKTISGDWIQSEYTKKGMVEEVPIDWLWQFRKVRGEMPEDLDRYDPKEREWIINIIKEERENINRLKKEILEEGLRVPLMLEAGRDGTVHLGEGNHRLIALKELGYENVPVRVVTGDTTFGNKLYETDVEKTDCFPSCSSPLYVFQDLEGYTPHPLLSKRDWKEEYR